MTTRFPNGIIANSAAWRRIARQAAFTSMPRRLLMADAPSNRRVACLTFDDGPHPEQTPRLLDVLRHEGVAASFFVIGQRAEQYPDIVARIAREGHVLGNHSFFHNRTTEIPVGQLIDEVRRTADLVEHITGRRPRCFRPPFGRLTPLAAVRLWMARQTVVLWNSNPRDFAMADADGLEECEWQCPSRAS